MKAFIKVEKEFDIKTVVVTAKVRYWEDGEVDGVKDENGDLIPCKKGDNWELEIDVDSGKINNWKIGVTADVHYKVCDAGEYILKSSEGENIVSFDGYVPSFMCPKAVGYGDYIIMKINSEGFIEGWEFTEDHIDEFLEYQD